MLAYARMVGRNYVLYPQGVHGALMTAGQNDGQDAGKDRGRDAGQNVTSQEKEPDAYTLWHGRLGHAGEEKMRLLQASVEGIPTHGPRAKDLRDLCAD
jgi:hypothetical protein